MLHNWDKDCDQLAVHGTWNRRRDHEAARSWKAAWVLQPAIAIRSGSTADARIPPLYLPDFSVVVRHALVVDDSESELCGTSRILRKLGYELCVARDGWEALKMMEIRSFSVVFLDHHMPQLDGMDCVRRLRSWEKQRRPGCRQFVCCVTGSVDVTGQQLIQAGMDEVLAKPISKSKLHAVDAKVIAKAACIPSSVPHSLAVITAANSMKPQRHAEQPEIDMLQQTAAFFGLSQCRHADCVNAHIG